MDEFGDSLIFLISQPRSGSTLLQNMLGGHPRVHTLPEPWFMLHLLYGERTDGLSAEYDARIAQQALLNYLSATEGGRKLYIDSIRAAAQTLYDAAFGKSEKDLFLDKTPRYYLIAEELLEIFPRARFIYLIRNPLAVLASILHPLGGDWTSLRRPDRMHDLITAPRNIVRATNSPRERLSVVKYESLIEDADGTLSRMFEQLAMEKVPGLTTYSAVDSVLGDTKSVTRHRKPVGDYLDRWKQELTSPEKRDVARSYLDELGEELIERLGYPYQGMMDQLGGDRQGSRAGVRWRTLRTPDDEIRWWQRLRLSFAHSRHQRGTLRTILRAAYMVVVGNANRRHDSGNSIQRGPA